MEGNSIRMGLCDVAPLESNNGVHSSAQCTQFSVCYKVIPSAGPHHSLRPPWPFMAQASFEIEEFAWFQAIHSIPDQWVHGTGMGPWDWNGYKH